MNYFLRTLIYPFQSGLIAYIHIVILGVLSIGLSLFYPFMIFLFSVFFIVIGGISLLFIYTTKPRNETPLLFAITIEALNRGFLSFPITVVLYVVIRLNS